MVTGLHKTDVQRVTASTLFSDVHGCPVVWNDDICATVQWALILVRAYSGHKRPGRAEGRSSGMSRLSSPGPCDFCWGTKQGYKPNFGFIFLAELPETHICRFQDEHSYQKKSCMRYCMNERSKTLKQREKRKTLVYFVWDGLEIVEYVTKLKFSRQLSWGWGSQPVLPTKNSIWVAYIHEAGHNSYSRANARHASLDYTTFCSPPQSKILFGEFFMV